MVLSALEYFLSLFDVIIQCDRETPAEADTPEKCASSVIRFGWMSCKSSQDFICHVIMRSIAANE